MALNSDMVTGVAGHSHQAAHFKCVVLEHSHKAEILDIPYNREGKVSFI